MSSELGSTLPSHGGTLQNHGGTLQNHGGTRDPCQIPAALEIWQPGGHGAATMACYTQEEIADRVGLTHQAVALVLQETAKLPELANLHDLDLSGQCLQELAIK